jgi:membrane-bound metal-dependent hydrolase YbcI (DUF457 family)
MTERTFPFTHSRIVRGAIALVLIAATIWVARRDDANGWIAMLFAIAPDFAFFAGIGQPVQKGQMPPRAIPVYNALHMLVGPIVLAGVALVLDRNMTLIGGALAWASHIMVDRTVGYGLRGRDGFQAIRR